MKDHSWKLAGKTLSSRLFLGTSRYPSLQILKEAVQRSEASVITVSVRRESHEKRAGEPFWSAIKACALPLLPNTAGCHSAKEAIITAHLARELFQTRWIKLEVIADEYSLMPDPFGLVEAAEILIEEGFEVFPFMAADLAVAERLCTAGCRILMPLASPIGTGRGVSDPEALKAFRHRFRDVTLIIDAGIGRPSHAALAMEMGFDGVLLNTAIATAPDPARMAEAFQYAIRAGRHGFESGLMAERNTAQPSTPVIGTPFWHHTEQSV